MAACYITGDFKAYFIENMTDLGLSVPSNLFDSYQKALESAAFITAALKTIGSGATVGQLVGATFLSEKILGLASLGGGLCGCSYRQYCGRIRPLSWLRFTYGGHVRFHVFTS